MKAWKKIAQPHDDVLTGSLKMSEFAADLSLVHAGTASKEYQDPAAFFERTYITEGMKELLVSVARRIKGQGGDPVVQLKTNFGGGKTHSMLAVYHLATRKVPTTKLKGVAQILDEVGIDDLPTAKVAVLVGTHVSANEPQKVAGGKELRTLWGRLAYDLLGLDGYEMVEQSDLAGMAPGSDVLVDLLKRAAPCVVLCDELVAFMGELVNPKATPAAGTFRANMTFFQNVTEAMKAVPNAMMLASLPQSEEELGGVDGETALLQLETVFTRIQAIWKPVGTEESFEIVRRRLFSTIGSEKERDETCRAYAAMYKANPDLFPPEVQEADYLDRMRKTYPIHPELFDRLFADWSTLQKFQKTRGVLQYMATVIKQLCQADNADPMIMPGSLALSDDEVEKKSTQYLTRTGWSAVIISEIDGKKSIAGRLDLDRPTFLDGKIAERTARTIFLGSAPGAEALQQSTARGIEQKRIVLGAAMPEQNLGVYEDALDALRDRSKYLNVDKTRYYYDTRPNLRREMEERRAHVEVGRAEDYLREVVQKVCGRGSYFSGVHVFTPHADIDDLIGSGPKLVVMKPEMPIAYSRQNEQRSFTEATAFLTKRGNVPRTKQNRLVFLFPDQNNVNRLVDQARTYLAWREIIDASHRGTLILDTAQLANAETNARRAESAVEVSTRDCYRFALIPESPDKRTIGFQVERIPTQSGAIATSIENFLVESGLLVKQWSSIFFKKTLETYYFKKDVEEVSLKTVWENLCSYLYLDRLVNEDVFVRVLIEGVRDKSFGFARGKDGAAYVGFAYGEEILLGGLDAGLLVLSKSKAEALHEARKCPTCHNYPCTCAVPPPPPPTGGAGGTGGANGTGAGGTGGTPASDDFHNFFGTVKINPHGGAAQFADIMGEVVNLLMASPGVTTEIKVDIHAHSTIPFDKNAVVRPVKVNCQTLHFEQEGTGFEA